jgi:formate hydrogenlyase subunit 3/multisubunit Na+/H+ antiporter MnhD subunit
MVARMSPLFELSETALSFVLVIGATTALFMGFLGIVNNDIKRVVAYSTLSQLGYMTVALGVSVDDVVHFLIWYRKGLRDGKSRRDSVMLAYEGCARAMYQSWAVLGLGLAVFALSTFVPTQRFGALMFTLLTGALIGNLLLLPAVLTSPLGSIFLLRLRRKVAARQQMERIERHAGSPPPSQPFSPAPHRREKSKRHTKA